LAAVPSADPNFGIPQDEPLAPPPPDTRKPASADEAEAVKQILATDSVLDKIGVPEARAASAKAAVYVLGPTLFSAIVPLSAPQTFDAAVPAWLGPAFGFDSPEIRYAHYVAEGVASLNVWVETSRKEVVQIDSGDGKPVSYEWIGEPPPQEPGD
jgi:hypothetical protein